MEITDPRGRRLEEVTARLTPAEVADLLVAASGLDDGSESRALLRDPAGNTLALYVDSGEASPLARHTDWWLGPVLLVLVIFLGVGAFTIARALIRLFF